MKRNLTLQDKKNIPKRKLKVSKKIVHDAKKYKTKKVSKKTHWPGRFVWAGRPAWWPAPSVPAPPAAGALGGLPPGGAEGPPHRCCAAYGGGDSRWGGRPPAHPGAVLRWGGGRGGAGVDRVMWGLLFFTDKCTWSPPLVLGNLHLPFGTNGKAKNAEKHRKRYSLMFL